MKLLRALILTLALASPVGAADWDYRGVLCSGEVVSGAWRVVSCPVHVHATSTRTIYLAFDTPITQVPFVGLRGGTAGFEGTLGFLNLHVVGLYPTGPKQNLVKVKLSNTSDDHYDVLVEALLPR